MKIFTGLIFKQFIFRSMHSFVLFNTKSGF